MKKRIGVLITITLMTVLTSCIPVDSDSSSRQDSSTTGESSYTSKESSSERNGLGENELPLVPKN